MSEDFLKIMLDRITKFDFLYFVNDFESAIIKFQSKSTGGITGEKHYQLVLMQNPEEGYKHIAVVIPKLGPEFEVLPNAVNDFLNKKDRPTMTIQDEVADNEISTDDYVFSRTVFLYTDILTVPKEDVKRCFKDNNFRLLIRDDGYRLRLSQSRDIDFFICHDSRDKDVFVQPLVQVLRSKGINIWYDEYSIQWGDSLIDKIEDGLRKCKYGIIVISKHFIANTRWPHTEFKSLKVREHNMDKKLILPIWLDVTRDDVSQYSLDLADRAALRPSDGLEKISNECIRILKPAYLQDAPQSQKPNNTDFNKTSP